MAPVRLGIFGGTFDPPHLGHLVVATHTRRLLDLDTVLWVVANDPWQKSAGPGDPPSTAPDRLEMARAAVTGLEGQVVEDLEIVRGGPSYTIDTVEALAAGRPVDELVLVVGHDAALGMATWHRAEALRELVEVAVVGRPDAVGVPLPEGWRWSFPDVPVIGVSSTDIRARYRDGRPTDLIVPAGVDAVVRSRGLYRDRR